jgi:hypothetical protein
MKMLNLIMDRYDREARLAPALLIALPAVLAAFAWFPELRSLGPAIVTLLGASGAVGWMAQLGRDRGSKLQPELYARWGGQLSIAALRHRDTLIPEPLKTRYHAFLARAVPGIQLPSAEDEARDPEAADRAYEAACAWLLAQTRDKKGFSLLFEENINYGFRRNFWGLKPLALAVSGLTLFASLAGLGACYVRDGRLPPTEAVGATLFVALYFALVLFWIRPDWVRVAAVAFARKLLEACDVLAASSDAPTKRAARKKS